MSSPFFHPILSFFLRHLFKENFSLRLLRCVLARDWIWIELDKCKIFLKEKKYGVEWSGLLHNVLEASLVQYYGFFIR